MEYTVVYSRTFEEFIELVNAHIRDGWQPQGGVHQHGPGAYFYQAMIRKN